MYIVSPHLFVTYTEKGMRDAETSYFGITIGGTAISNLRYADDTALIENSKEALEHLTKNVNEVGKQLNLKLNIKKTKLMVTGSLKEEHNITIDGKKLSELRASSIWTQR